MTKVYWEAPTSADAALQVNISESLLECQADGILISCSDAGALKEVIGRAVAAGSQIELLPIRTGEDDVQKSVEAVSQHTAANADLAGCFCRWMAVFC